MHRFPTVVEPVGRRPPQCPGKGIPHEGVPADSIDQLAVVVPTVAVGIADTQAPNEREDERKRGEQGPPSHAVTCAFATSPVNSIGCARAAPRAVFGANQ